MLSPPVLTVAEKVDLSRSINRKFGYPYQSTVSTISDKYCSICVFDMSMKRLSMWGSFSPVYRTRLPYSEIKERGPEEISKSIHFQWLFS